MFMATIEALRLGVIDRVLRTEDRASLTRALGLLAPPEENNLQSIVIPTVDFHKAVTLEDAILAPSIAKEVFAKLKANAPEDDDLDDLSMEEFLRLAD